MKELYFITLLGHLNCFAVILSVLLIIAFVVVIGFYLTGQDVIPKQLLSKIKKISIWSFWVSLFFAVVSVVIPTQKELYMIYGVGGVIDELKQNPQIKELPDKTIEYLNCVADRYINEEKAKEEGK